MINCASKEKKKPDYTVRHQEKCKLNKIFSGGSNIR